MNLARISSELMSLSDCGGAAANENVAAKMTHASRINVILIWKADTHVTTPHTQKSRLIYVI